MEERTSVAVLGEDQSGASAALVAMVQDQLLVRLRLQRPMALVVVADRSMRLGAMVPMA
jgi:hypothetical protein